MFIFVKKKLHLPMTLNYLSIYKFLDLHDSKVLKKTLF